MSSRYIPLLILRHITFAPLIRTFTCSQQRSTHIVQHAFFQTQQPSNESVVRFFFLGSHSRNKGPLSKKSNYGSCDCESTQIEAGVFASASRTALDILRLLETAFNNTHVRPVHFTNKTLVSASIWNWSHSGANVSTRCIHSSDSAGGSAYLG